MSEFDGDTGVDEARESEGNVITLRPRTAEQPVAGEAGGDAGDPREQHQGSDAPVAELRRAAPASAAPLEHQIEALLFVSPTPLTTPQLAEITDEHEDDLHDCLLDMMQSYAEGSRGIVLERVAGGWAFRAADACAEQLRRLVRPQGDAKLSPSALETLAIVAYIQPVSRPDIAKIRGVSVDAAMNGLMERGLVEEAGRSESGAVLFRTTAHFERAFGLEFIGSLPELEGFGPDEAEVARLREQLEQMAAARID